jgi:hypothetical protein
MPTSPNFTAPHIDTIDTRPQTPTSRRQSRHEKNRLSLSFLKRGTSETSTDASNIKTQNTTTGMGTSITATNGSLSAGATAAAAGGGGYQFLDESSIAGNDSSSRATTPRSRSKSANRRSWLGRRSSTDIAEEPLPQQQQSTSASRQPRPPGTSATNRSRSSVSTGLRNNTEERPITSNSAAPSGTTSSITSGVDKVPQQSRVGSVKKRFSLLKLGGGGTKRGARGVDAVVE